MIFRGFSGQLDIVSINSVNTEGLFLVLSNSKNKGRKR